jgi:hypothetical protein
VDFICLYIGIKRSWRSLHGSQESLAQLRHAPKTIFDTFSHSLLDNSSKI